MISSVDRVARLDMFFFKCRRKWKFLAVRRAKRVCKKISILIKSIVYNVHGSNSLYLHTKYYVKFKRNKGIHNRIIFFGRTYFVIKTHSLLIYKLNYNINK